MNKFLVLIGGLLIPTVLNADQLLCRFDRECIEIEPCVASNYQIEIDHQAFADSTDSVDYGAQWVDKSATRTVIYRRNPKFAFAMWAENQGEYFGRLSLTANMEARLAIQDLSAPRMITFHGTCEERI